MKAVQLVHRGHVRAAGFIIDVPTIGLVEARRRVVQMLAPADRLFLLPDERWLLLLDTPIEVDSDQTIGMPLVNRDGQLAAAPDTTGIGAVTEHRFGTSASFGFENLPAIDHSGWFDLGATLRIDAIRTPPAPHRVVVSTPEPVDMRSQARIGGSPEAAADLVREMKRLAGANRPGQMGQSNGNAKRRRRFAGQNERSGSAPVPPKRLRNALTRRVLRTPAAGYVHRKHAQYIEELTRQFHGGDLGEALRRAIPLGGSHAATLSLRLPQRRANLQITDGRRGGTAVPYEPSVHQHLMGLYRQAAKQLEARGEIDQAAYVLVELLGDALGCVAMLERHDRFELAATIAEQRRIEPAVVVRLWWLAKDRKRAIAVARRHGAFTAALKRLETVDKQAADELRVEWIAHLEQAGDLLGAVEAAWPRPPLHRLLVNVVRRGELLGGPSGGALRAYALSLQPTDERVASALELLRRGAEPTGERSSFLATFAKVSCSDPAMDRSLATAYVRMNPRAPSGRGVKSDWTYKIRMRADAALVADLPAGESERPSHEVIEPVRLPAMPPGNLSITDAAALPSGHILVALGSLGCRLLNRGGATVAEWHLPTNRIVMADHGGVALLLDQRPGGQVDIRRLDLTTRRLDRYGTMELATFADSFDGAQWLVVDRVNLAIVDITEPAPTISWRPLEPGVICHSLLRTPRSVTAMVRAQLGASEPRLELWAWDSTMGPLAVRRVVTFPVDVDDYFLIPKGFVTQSGFTVKITHHDGPVAQPVPFVLDAVDGFSVVGDLLIRIVPNGDGHLVCVERVPGRTEVVRHDVGPAEAALMFRSHGSLVTIWDEHGRLHVVDLDQNAAITSVRALL